LAPERYSVFNFNEVRNDWLAQALAGQFSNHLQFASYKYSASILSYYLIFYRPDDLPDAKQQCYGNNLNFKTAFETFQHK